MASRPTNTGIKLSPTVIQPVKPSDTVARVSDENSFVQDTTVAYGDQNHSAESSARPQQIGRYEILGEIARGGMGVVYRVFDRQLDRVVALKLIKSGELADADQIERFQTEAKAAAQLDHPGIVQVYEVGEFGGQHFMAMAFIDGHSLWQEVKESPLAPKLAAKLMQQVAEAVQYAHEHGIVHRDLKPQNILLTKDGHPKVTDFGLAKRQESDSSLTETGQALGTPSYMPPEQAQGKVKQVGPLADVYSLGATLYCLLTGRPPFQAATQLETMLQVVEQEPVSPKSLNRAVSVDLETICLRCLEKESAKRYASAGALANDLARYLSGEPIQARRVGRLERVLKWIARKPMTAAAYGLSAVTAALVVIGVTISVFWRNAETARSLAVAAQSEAISARQQTEIALDNEKIARAGEEEARRELQATKEYDQYVLNVRLAPTLWENGWAKSARQALETCPQNLRGWEWKYLHRLTHPELAVLSGHKRYISDLQLSPDQSKIASLGGSEVILWDAVHRTQLAKFTENLNGVKGIAFSPDSRHLLFSNRHREGRPIIWEIQYARAIATPMHSLCERTFSSPDGSLLVSLGTDGDGFLKSWTLPDFREIPFEVNYPIRVERAFFTPDSRRLVARCRTGPIEVWDARTGKSLASLTVPAVMVRELRLSPDGRLIAAAYDNGAVRLWSLEQYQEVAVIQNKYPQVVECFSPDSQSFLTKSVEGHEAKIWDARTGQQRLFLPGKAGGYRKMTFSTDGEQIATACNDGTLRAWDVVNGEEVASWKGHTSTALQLVYTADGTRLISGGLDESVRIWDAVQRNACDGTITTNELNPDLRAAFSDDGSAVATTGEDYSVNIWDLATGRMKSSLRGHTQRISGLAFNALGTNIASVSVDQTARIWDVATSQTLCTLSGHSKPITRIAFRSDGQIVATSSEDGTAKVWDAVSGQERFTLTGHTSSVRNIAISPNGNWLATTSEDNTVRIWDGETGHQKDAFTWEAKSKVNHRPVAFSPDSSRLASAEYNCCKLWDVSSGRELATLSGHPYSLLELKFSQDGRWLVTAGHGTFIKVWDGNTGQEVATLHGHSEDVPQVAFSPDGRRLASASYDHSVRLWDTSTWQEVATLKRHSYPVTNVAFSADGRRLASTGFDGTIQLWIAEESESERTERRSWELQSWRLGRARRAEERGNWYAAAFHLGWLLLDQPDDAPLKSRHEQMLTKLKEAGRTAPPLPQRTGLSGAN